MTERAFALLALGRPAEAAQMLRRAIAAEPDNGEAYRLLAHAMLDLGQPALALDAARTAVALMPQNAAVHRVLAASSAGVGKRSEAVAAARHAVHLEPNGWRGHALLGEILATAGGPRTWRTAIQAAARAIELAPEEPVVYRSAAQVAIAGGRMRKAVALLEQAMALEPDNPDTLRVLADVQHRRSRLFAALNLAAMRARTDPTGEAVGLGLERTMWGIYALFQIFALFAALITLGMVADNVDSSTPGSQPAATPLWVRTLYAAAVLAGVGALSRYVHRRLSPPALRMLVRRFLRRPMGVIALVAPVTGIGIALSAPLLNTAGDVPYAGAALGVILLCSFLGLADFAWGAGGERVRASVIARAKGGPVDVTAVWWNLGMAAIAVAMLTIVPMVLADADPELWLRATMLAVTVALVGWLFRTVHRRVDLVLDAGRNRFLRRPAAVAYLVLVTGALASWLAALLPDPPADPVIFGFLATLAAALLSVVRGAASSAR